MNQTTEIPETVVNENARLELMRCLADFRDWLEKWNKENGREPGYLRFVPLFEEEWKNSEEMIRLAAREARALGHVEYTVNTEAFFGLSEMIAITDAGYAWIRSRDAVGEVAQEGA